MFKILEILDRLPGAVYQRLSDLYFDLIYRVNTVTRVSLTNTDVGVKGSLIGNKYQPTGVARANKILDYLIKYGNNGFVDFGSGKGQILLLAAKKGFKPVTGVEFSQLLHNIALRNIEIFFSKNKLSCKPVTICIDAREYQIKDEDCIFYFFYPFKPVVMETVVENIEKSTSLAPRRITVIYVYPKDKDIFNDRKNWTLIETFKVGGWKCRIHIFNQC